MDDAAGKTDTGKKPYELAEELFRSVSIAVNAEVVDKSDIEGEYRERFQINDYQLASLLKAWKRRRAKTRAEYEDGTLLALEERIKQKLIGEFIDGHFQGATKEEDRYLYETIKNEYEAGDDYTDTDHCLQTFLTDGLIGIRKRRKREKRSAAFKSSGRIVWALIKGVVKIGIVLSIYPEDESRFGVTVLSILVYIYATVEFAVNRGELRFIAQINKADLQFIEIRKLLGKKTTFAELEEAEMPTKELKKYNVSILIYQGTTGIISLIALWKLVRAIGWI